MQELTRHLTYAESALDALALLSGNVTVKQSKRWARD